MSYYISAVNDAVGRILKEIPTAQIFRCDYGYGLTARIGDKAWIIFQPQRDEFNQPEIVANLDEAIAEMQQ